jgi:hypothetical protein
MEPGVDGLPVLFVVLFAVAGVFILGVATVIVLGISRSRRVLRDNGLDPLTAHAQIAARFANGPLAAPATSIEQRLAELADLHRRGIISQAEHDAARAAALTERP